MVRAGLAPIPAEIAGESGADLRLLHESGLPEEAYLLEVMPSGVEIRASGGAGWFYGLQTLHQLLPGDGSLPDAGYWTLPCVRIEDRPRFRWRGLMLDTVRHFFPVEVLKRLLDQMARYKLNVFHWHLTDDQGWRLQILRYPLLTEVGSRRTESPLAGDRDSGDGVPCGGFYTQDEVRDVVSYAAERQIRVVPEIEMPGHAGALIAAYPHLGNTDAPGFHPAVWTRWGVSPQILAPTDEVFEFLENVLGEVAGLFPGDFIHVGGDEVPKQQWRESPRAQKIMKAAGLKSAEEMQTWFLARIEKFLRAQGKHLVGWDDISEGGLLPSAVVMVWRDWEWARKALAAGNPIVMTPTSHCYFDYLQGPQESEPEAIGGDLTLETVYSFKPVPGDFPGGEAGVLGIQGNLWTEYIRDRDHLDYMAWPRAAALAEVAWSPCGSKDWGSFERRLASHVPVWKTRGIRFRPLDLPGTADGREP